MYYQQFIKLFLVLVPPQTLYYPQDRPFTFTFVGEIRHLPPGLDEIYRSNAPPTDPSVLQVLCPMIGSLKCVPRSCLVDSMGL